MDSTKIASAVARLERNLPIRYNQTRRPEPLRRLHRRILRHYLEHGAAPVAADFADVEDWQAGIERLASEHIIVLDDHGAIGGAYPFVDAARDFRVTTDFGAVNAMCAFDALAVSSMFELPVRIDSHCRLSAQTIVIEQQGAQLRVVEPAQPVLAAIDWQGAVGASRCAATLCLEMMFIAGDGRAADWCAAGAGSREIFTLPEAHALIAAVFVPMID